MSYKKIEACHSEEHKQRVRTSILGETDVVGHERQGEGARKSDERRELPCQEIDHGDGKDSEDQGDNAKISFWSCKGMEEMGKNEEQGRMKIRGILLIIFYLTF